MKYKIIPFILLIFILSGCTKLGTYDYNLDYNDREIPITVKVGETINISLVDRLKSSWETSVYDNRVLLFKEKIRWKTEVNNVSLSMDAFIFSALYPGQTIINIVEMDNNNQQLDMFSVFVIVEE